MIKAYLDTNVFITALQFGKTNSAKLINMSGKFMSLYTGVICEYLLEEIKDYYEKQNSRDHANKVVFFIKNLNLKTLSNLTVDMEKESYSSLITDADDLPHITAAIIEDCDYFVTLNRKLTQMKAKKKINFVTPMEFVKILDLSAFDTEHGE